MGFMDELKRLARPYEDDVEEADYEDEESEAEPARERPRRSTQSEEPSYSGYSDSGSGSSDRRSSSGNVVNINTTTQLQVVLVKPEKFDEASAIANHLRDKRTVVLNLEAANKDIARRMVDFLSGVAYALEGKIKKVAISTYIITPYNVDIIGDLMDELESNGMHF
ncbi:MAG: cell division protein SepF [Clostridiales bacterium]|nr:cell division protein SepF [Clostridiales bacterium]MCD7882027.1 cell division protein SepF [Clostridiales bacterium]